MEEHIEREIFYRLSNIINKEEEKRIREIISKWASSTSGQLLLNLGDAISFKELMNLPSYKITILTQQETRSIDIEYFPADRISIMNHPDRDKNNLSIDVWNYEFEISDGFFDKISRKQVDGSDKLETCPKCDGTGKKFCSDCYGHGELKCNNCAGQGEETCSHCRGKGETQCESCRGRGENKCYNCKGKGYYTPILGDHEERCSVCGARGYIPCKKCSNGFIRCSSCGSSGRIRCDVCYGKGILRCDNCNGKGEIECRNCDGTGFINSFVYVKDQFSKYESTIVIYDNPDSGLKKHIDLASSEIVFHKEEDGFLDLQNINIEEPVIKDVISELMKIVSNQYESIKYNSKILRQKLLISRIDNVFARYEYKENIYELNIICNIVYSGTSPIDHLLESMYEEAESSYKRKNLNEALKIVNKLSELKPSKELGIKLILLKNRCIKIGNNYTFFGAFLGVLASIISYYFVFTDNIKDIYINQPTHLYAFLIITLIFCCFTGFVITSKINRKKKIILGFYLSFVISFLTSTPLCYYFQNVVEKMGGKSINSVANSYSSNMVGKWVGQLNGASLVVTIETQKGNNFEGINTVHWKKNKVTRKITGSLNGTEIILNEPGTDKGDGKFVGILSGDGKSMSGTWQRFSGGQEKKWSVMKK
jgi:uncharacterized membrane protein